jgi:hypothetical protein
MLISVSTDHFFEARSQSTCKIFLPPTTRPGPVKAKAVELYIHRRASADDFHGSIIVFEEWQKVVTPEILARDHERSTVNGKPTAVQFVGCPDTTNW